jgi:hypothetical protein
MKIGTLKSFLRAEMKLFSSHPLLISYSNEFLRKISEYNVFDNFFLISWKSTQWSLYFSCGSKWTTCICVCWNRVAFWKQRNPC